MKKTLLTIIAALLLGGVVNAQNGWDTDPNSHTWSSNTPIVAAVSIEGVAQTDLTNLTLGAFAGEELRGRANVANHSVDNNQFWIQVFYNYNTTEAISFKLYDAATQIEYTSCTVTPPTSTQDQGWGTPSNPVVLDFTTTPQTQTQTIALVAGWNCVSLYIDMTDVSGMDMLKSALGDHGVAIQTISDAADYFGDGLWVGLEGYELTNNEMVMVKVEDDCSITLSGSVVDASNVEITINPGWNWIGFPIASETPIDVAMSAFEPEFEDVIQDLTGTSDYFGEWIGDIMTLVPGRGYLYYSSSSSPKVLVFTSASSKNK
jgi:hypothetical protein